MIAAKAAKGKKPLILQSFSLFSNFFAFAP